MKQKLTRREFSQLAIASTAGVAVGSLAFATKSLAQTPNLIVYGVSAGASSRSAAARATALSSDAPSAVGIVVQSLNLKTNKVQSVTSQIESQKTPRVRGGDKLTKQPAERLIGLSSLPDDTLIIASTPLRTPTTVKPSRLTFLGKTPRTLTVSGLDLKSEVDSFLVTNDGLFLALVVESKGTPSYKLANIDTQTGQISFIKFALPEDQRIENLTQCPNGNIYATATGRRDDIKLVQLDLNQQQLVTLAPLQIDKMPWQNGLRDLGCSPEGQLIALGSPNKYASINSLYTVDAKTGAMTRLREFAVNKISFART